MIRRLVCRVFGHKWYTYSWGQWVGAAYGKACWRCGVAVYDQRWYAVPDTRSAARQMRDERTT